MEANTTDLAALHGGPVEVEVLTVDEQVAIDVHHEILELKKTYERTYFRMAELLYRVSTEKLYRRIGPGYKSFEDYSEQELEFSFRKAKYLASIWWWFGIEMAGHPKLLSEAHSIGWSKAKELVRVVDLKNADQWFGLAREKNTGDLGKLARAALAAKGKKRSRTMPDDAPPTPSRPPKVPQGGDAMGDVPMEGGQVVAPDPYAEHIKAAGVEPPTLDQVKDMVSNDKETGWAKLIFDTTAEHRGTIEDAIKAAGELGESSHRGHLLSLICLHFVSFNTSSKSVNTGEWMAQIERLTGLKLVAVDEKLGRIVYGEETVNALGGGDEE